MSAGRLCTLAAGRHRLAVVVAQQRRHAHRLAGAVQVAAGPGEHVEPGILAPGHGELAQVQRRLVERQHRQVGAAARHQHLAGVERVVQQRVAVGVGLAFQEQLALGVEDAQFHFLRRLAALQRGGVHEQLVLVGARVQADVADGEERGVVFVLEPARALHHREVQARRLQLLDVLDRQIGQRALVLVAAEHEAVDVDRLGQLRNRGVVAVVAVHFPATAAAAALVLGEERRQRAFLDPHELHVHFRHIERHHRQTAALARRQHAALRGEADRRLQFAGVDLLLERLAQAAAVGGEQIGRDQHGVVLGRLHVRIAQGLAIVGQRPGTLVGADFLFEAQQRVEVLGADQRARELQRQRQPVALLVGIGADQAEALHRFLLALHRLAAGIGQLPGFVTLAAAQRQRQTQQQEAAQQPRTHEAPLPLRIHVHTFAP